MAIVDNADLEPVGGTLSGGGADQERRQLAAEAAAENGGVGGFKREMKDLEELFSKLNPMAEEFVPRSLSSRSGGGGRFYPDELAGGAHNGFGDGDANGFVTRRIYGINQGRRRMNIRTCMAQRADRIRKTVYVSDIDTLVTEEDLAALFARCGQVMDCRVCCDATSVLRFAFIEFEDEESARDALELTGTVLGFYPLKMAEEKQEVQDLPKYDLDAKRDACLDLTIRRFVYSSLAGAFGGLLLFRSPTTRWASVAFGAGVGIGSAYTDCSYIFGGSLPKWPSPKASAVPPVPLQDEQK